MLPQHRCSYVCPFCLVWWDDAEGAASCCLKATEGKKKVRKRGTCPGKTLHRTKVKTSQIWKKQQQGAEPAPASPRGAGHPHPKSQSPEVLRALRAFLTSPQGGLVSENLSGAFFFFCTLCNRIGNGRFVTFLPFLQHQIEPPPAAASVEHEIVGTIKKKLY